MLGNHSGGGGARQIPPTTGEFLKLGGRTTIPARWFLPYHLGCATQLPVGLFEQAWGFEPYQHLPVFPVSFF